MASRTIHSDDITGQDITGEVITRKVADSELEMSEDTATAFDALIAGDLETFADFLKPYAKKKTPKAAGTGDKLDMTVVRAWAKAQKMDIKDRGAVPADVIDAYRLSLAS
jgi:hypothetical protein